MSGCGYEYRETAIADIGGAFGVNSVAFDRFEEILWSGNAAGHVSSHIGPNLGRYTSFQVHMEEEIRQILPIESVVLCLTRSGLRGQLRRGIPAFTFKSDLITDLQTVLATGPAAVLLGGHQENILEVDLNNQRIVRIVNDTTSGCGILRRHSRFICCGGFDGKISLRDPLTLREEHSLTAHMSALNDFDVQGNTLISCGFSVRSGAMVPDRFLTVYDLRMNRKMSPVPLSLEPFLLKFMPAFSSRLALLSTMGQLIVFDAIAGPASAAMMEHVTANGAIGISLDISSSCQCIAVGDSTGYVHRFSISPDSVVNSFSRPTEFADPIIPIEPIAVDDLSAALSSIPMPVTPSKRLSDWPAELIKPRYRPTPPIPDDILESMRMVGTIGYAPKPANRRPNQV
ncbi:PAN2-PAN3 deadenylation complex catalytic subunit PAN2-like [Artemia franciscana]|uniref:PAN2-PAN3 deadenylation complex catalytic subunit PAN2-like n=1 Tax=Artemia franciscana TaxID=6661 RepID=UPI0032DA85F2